MTQLEIGMISTGQSAGLKIDPAKLEKAIVDLRRGLDPERATTRRCRSRSGSEIIGADPGGGRRDAAQDPGRLRHRLASTARTT